MCWASNLITYLLPIEHKTIFKFKISTTFVSNFDPKWIRSSLSNLMWVQQLENNDNITPQPLYNTVRYNTILDIPHSLKMDLKNV